MSSAVPRPTAVRQPIIPWRELLHLDLRSLALFRVCLGLLLISDWLDRIADLRAHYTDAGIVPRHVITMPVPLSVHFFSGDLWLQVVWLLVALVFAGLLLVGYRTVFSTFISWFLLISVHARNPAVLQGGDQVLRLLLFWSIFLPLGACWSVDSARSRSATNEGAGPRTKAPVVGLASLALLLQISQIYWFAGAWKWRDEWRDEASAVYFALRVEYFTTPLGSWLLQFPEALSHLTRATLWLEILGPVVLFLPFAPALQRLLIIAAFVLFHAGLGVTLELSNFPWVCTAAWLVLLPSAFWDRLQLAFPHWDLSSRLARWAAQSRRGTALPGTPLAVETIPWAPPTGGLTQLLLVALIIYSVLYNIGTFFSGRGRELDNPTEVALGETIFPPQLAYFGAGLALEQGWGMFAPGPGRASGWFYAEGELFDGTRVNLPGGGPPSGQTKPQRISNTFPNGRWRKMMMNLPAERNHPYLRPGYAAYLYREWNRSHPKSQRLKRVEVYWMREWTAGPKEPPARPEQVFLVSYEPESALMLLQSAELWTLATGADHQATTPWRMATQVLLLGPYPEQPKR